jgi:hypothetical protein
MFSRTFMGTPGAAAWPAANRAIYAPLIIESWVLVTQLFIYVGAAAGTADIGIYDVEKKKLVSSGATNTAGTNTLQLFDVTDTLLTPGNYWLGMDCSTVTTLTLFRWTTNLIILESVGVQQEAVGSATLPATATFANPANSYLPVMGCLIDLAA